MEQTPVQPAVSPTEESIIQPTMPPIVIPASQSLTMPHTATTIVLPKGQPAEQAKEQPPEQPSAQPTEQPPAQPTAQPTAHPTAQTSAKITAHTLSSVSNRTPSILLSQSQERLELLNDIDKFRAIGLDDLPQIVVCGDTSSGKSSVLEALSGIPFPTDAGLCTRFATEIALRFSTKTNVYGHAYITPEDRSSDSHKERVKHFNRQITSFIDVPKIIQDAKVVMGVESKDISRDILHIKLEGHDMPNLTLVDLPGVVHSMPDPKDVTAVLALVESYFRKKKSLILAIVSAEVPLENQKVLAKALECDSTGERTIGVITKPDLLLRAEKDRLKPAFLQLAKNENAAFKFRRPWHVVRCLNDDERRRGEDRTALEHESLSQRPWSDLGREQLGIRNLGKSLSQHLERHMVEQLPSLVNSIKDRISHAKLSLSSLGEVRVTTNEQRQYLIQLSTHYKSLVEAALNGNYRDALFFIPMKQTRRLRAVIMAEADHFDSQMQSSGHNKALRSALHTETETKGRAKRDALLRVSRLIHEYRGPELHLLFNSDLVAILFKEQSIHWEDIATEYIMAACETVEVFLQDVVRHICPEAGKTASLLLERVFQDAMEVAQESLRVKVNEMLSPRTQMFLYSSKARLEMSLKRVESEDEAKSVDADSEASLSPIPNEPTCVRLLQYSRAYYDVAVETFIDNVVVLGVENCLLAKIVEMFSAETVARMSDEELQLFGGETASVVRERDDLRKDLEILEQSLRRCQRHCFRELGADSNKLVRMVEQKQPPLSSVYTHALSRPLNSLSTDTESVRANSDGSSLQLSHTAPIAHVSKSPQGQKTSVPNIFGAPGPEISNGLKAQPSKSPQSMPAASSSIFGGTPPASSGSLGATTPGSFSLFGSQPPKSPQSKPAAPSSIFGGTPPASSGSLGATTPGSFSLFGSQPPKSPQSKPATSANVLGQPSSTNFSNYGGTTVGGFGRVEAQAPKSPHSKPASSSGVFGGTSSTPFTFGSVGQAKPQTSSLFSSGGLESTSSEFGAKPANKGT